MLNVSTHYSDFQSISYSLILCLGVTLQTTHIQGVLSQISSSVLHMTDESNLYLNFVQVQNIMISIVDFVFTFACDFFTTTILIQWYPQLFFLSRLFFDKYFNIVVICVVISSVFCLLYLFLIQNLNSAISR